MGDEAGPARSEFPLAAAEGIAARQEPADEYQGPLSNGQGINQRGKDYLRTGCFDYNFVGSAKATCLHNGSLGTSIRN